jgi:hypothetical protein
VTVQEAFAELGVDPGADVETIRRAYLRLIKERKPESDPDGFKRAREAFEVARASGEMEALVAASASTGIDVLGALGAAVGQHDGRTAGQIKGRRLPSINQATIENAEVAEE